MRNLVDEILSELEYISENGILDFSKSDQVAVLEELLRSSGVNNSKEIAEKTAIYFMQLKEKQEYTAARERELNTILKQKIQNPETKKPIQVSTALGYGKDHPAYAPAMQMLAAKKFSEKDLDITDAKPEKEKPTSQKKGKKSEPNVFGKTGKAASVFPEPKEKKATKSKKKNPNEGTTVAETKPEEVDSIISDYVSMGEPTPDEMRKLNKGYSSMDMAETYDDDSYYSANNGGRKHSTKVRTKSPYKFDNKTRNNLKKAGFPEKYIKFVERCINTQVSGKKPPVTELIQQGGAGQIQSQFGEVMAMAFMSIRDPEERKKLAEIIKSEIQKSNTEFGGGKASAIATADWVNASLTHAESFDAAMDERYGKGQWRFEGASWDIRDDVEALGLDYKNKGFSTDVMLRVQPLDKNGNDKGPARAQKCSLKKDENIFFFNGSINEINNFSLNYLDENERKKVRGYENIVTKANSKNKEEKIAAIRAAERITGLSGGKAIQKLKDDAKELREKAFNSAPPNVKDAISSVRNFAKNQLNSSINLVKKANTNVQNPNSVIDNAKTIDAADKEFAKLSYKIVKGCKSKPNVEECIRAELKKNGEESGDDRVSKVAVMATKVAEASGDNNASKELQKHYNIAVEAGNSLMMALPDSPQLMGGLMQKLADAFPLNTCMSGEEFMLIDGMKVTQKSLQTVFGVSSYQEIEKGLKLKKLPNGEIILVYGGKTKDGKEIPIGIVQARQKGKGYEGTVGFEIQCSDEFAYAIGEANIKNGDNSSSNTESVRRIGERLRKRSKK